MAVFPVLRLRRAGMPVPYLAGGEVEFRAWLAKWSFALGFFPADAPDFEVAFDVGNKRFDSIHHYLNHRQIAVLMTIQFRVIAV
jgi:hypothetical protein